MPTTNMRTDGLTPMNQGSSQRSWWDDSFSRLLFDAIPLDTEQLVEVDCGLAAAAHSLLPSLPNGRYLGLDFTPERLAEAKKQMLGAHIEPRVDLRLGPATSIPVEESSCDIVLSIMSLQHNPDVPAVLEEAKRALKPGGRFVAVEPDNLGQRFYFDGVLEEINRVIHALCLKARVAKQPSDIALGPRLPALLREAKFGQIQMRPHMVQSSRNEPAADFFGRLRRIASTTAAEAGLDAADEALEPCEQAINRSQFAGMPKRLGYSAHTVPVFLCVGRKA
jgi:ubiquinone/menaquinone biosynthesis C-methylase UbiE